MVNEVRIGSRAVGPGHPCFVIAEAGVNHNGDLSCARRLVDAATDAGADAVKFQTFSAERLAAPDALKADYQARATGAGSQLEMLRRLELSPEAHEELRDRCANRGITFLSSCFDEAAVGLLERLGTPALKIPSGEITNRPLLERAARTGRPLIVSTGMARLDEVKSAVQTLREAGAHEIVLLHCVSGYPADPADANLRAMETLRAATGLPVGYSDHTLGVEVALAAVALGACVLEKHFTLDRLSAGPDHGSSLEPGELVALVRGVRAVEAALGHGRKEPAPGEAGIAAAARRSLAAGRHIAAGSTLAEETIVLLRPGTGLPPELLPSLVGRRAKTDIPAGTLLTMDMIQ